jgi:two-component system response regulator YesN
MVFSKLKSSILYKWVVSYFLILVIPICFGMTLLISAQKMITSMYMDTTQILYQQIGNVIEEHISKMNTIKNQLSSNTELNFFIGLKPESIDKNRYSLVKIKNQLYSYSVANNNSDFYVYIKNIDSALAPDSLYSKETAFAKFHGGNLSINKDTWFDYLNEFHSQTINILKDNNSGKCSVVIISSIPNLKIYTPRATMVQVLESSSFSSILKNIFIEDETELILLDSENNVIYSNYNEKKRSQVEYNLLEDNSGQIEIVSDGEKKLVFYHASNILDWKYAFVIPKRFIDNKIGKIRVYIFIFVIFSMVIGYILSYFLALHNYNPIRKIIDNIKPYNKNTNDKHEYDQIETAFNTILEIKNELNKVCIKQTLLIQNNFIETLLKEEIKDHNQIHEIITFSGTHFKSDIFCVFALCEKTQKSLDSKDDPLFLQEVFENEIEVLQNNAFKDVIMYPIEIDNLMVILVNFNPKSAENTYNSLSKEIFELAAEQKRPIFISISKLCNGIAMVHHAYIEAVEILSYKLFVHGMDTSAIKTVNIEPETDRGYAYSTQQEEQIINLLNRGNIEGAIKLFNKICWVNFVHKKVSFNMARCIFFDISSSVYKLINSQSKPNNQVLDGIDKLFKELNRAETSNEMYRITKKILIYTGENINEILSKISLTEEIASCVKNHFHESDFNVSKVAQYLSMNISYLSKYFKENTGIGLLDYIHSVRINHAKYLLSNGDLTVTEISSRVGFENVNTFIRVFKKYEGTTPGLY